jgi:hypothetical protein
MAVNVLESIDVSPRVIRILLFSLVILMLLDGCAKAALQTQGSIKPSIEQEIRAALCDLEKSDFINAQKRMDAVLKSDPENIYAQKVLLGILTKSIKMGDSSPENKARIKSAIEALNQATKNPKFTPEQKSAIDRYVITLYRQLGDEEVTGELQKRAADLNRTATERAESYTVLASRSWNCSFRITAEMKVLEKSELERAESCLKSGLDYSERAIALDSSNEGAWSYKATLLNEAVKLAEFQNNQTQKTSYQRQSVEARRRAEELAKVRRDAEEKEWDRRSREREAKLSSSTPVDQQAALKELTEYRDEASLEDSVNEVFNLENLELATLVAPIPIPEEKPRETTSPTSRPVEVPAPLKGCFRAVDGQAQVQEKRDWKQFSPDGDLTVELPDNVCEGAAGGFTAASEGVMYTVKPWDRPAGSETSEAIDGLLNVVTKTFLSFRSRVWVNSGSVKAFEVKLLRKDNVNGQPRKIYAYALVSCSERKENVFATVASVAHYYTIDITGASESDPRVQRFLTSMRLK